MFVLRPPDLLRHEPLFDGTNVFNSQENGDGTRCAAIVNHYAIVNLLCRANLLRRSIFSTVGSFGESAPRVFLECPKGVPDPVFVDTLGDTPVTLQAEIWPIPYTNQSMPHLSQRAQRSTKIQSCSKFSISLEMFNLARKFQSRRLEFPDKNRAAVGGSLEN